jgi:hypothetical protein
LGVAVAEYCLIPTPPLWLSVESPLKVTVAVPGVVEVAATLLGAWGAAGFTVAVSGTLGTPVAESWAETVPTAVVVVGETVTEHEEPALRVCDEHEFAVMVKAVESEPPENEDGKVKLAGELEGSW